MMLAQQLYEGVSLGKTSVGLITYMRTDSVRLADVAVDEIRDYIKQNFGSEFCPAKENHYSTKRTLRTRMRRFVRLASCVPRPRCRSILPATS